MGLLLYHVILRTFKPSKKVKKIAMTKTLKNENEFPLLFSKLS